VPARPGLVSTEQHPLQGFFWGDYTTRYGHDYTYRVVAMKGGPAALQRAESVTVRIATEREDQGTHAVYFNRGVAGSQAYARLFRNLRPDKVAGRRAFRWLSRGLFRAILGFIDQAKGPGWGLRVAAYEFQQGAVLKHLKQASQRGADVAIVYDDRAKKGGPAAANEKAVRSAGLQGLAKGRTENRSFISHNKFIVLLRDDKPIAVWTGSTNFTDGGIFGHSNCGHVVRDAAVASAYLEYWKQLHADPPAATLRDWTEQNSPVPMQLPVSGTSPVFSPRHSLDALKWYADRMDAAQTAVFLTAAFGVNDLFETVLQEEKPYLRYVLLERADSGTQQLRGHLLNRIAVANILPANALTRWLQERLTGLNGHVKYIHTKYMLIDPLGDEPLVITGSANFSDPSTTNNDENMLLIGGDSRVADLYLSEFIRLFNHFQFRDLAQARVAAQPNDPRTLAARARAAVTTRSGRRVLRATDSAAAPPPSPDRAYLDTTDAWKDRYYKSGEPKCLERIYFAGP
jgi:phosphatidylserine/phosphatidylglycerophosphate/cardiolipin synthase-like enzyme